MNTPAANSATTAPHQRSRMPGCLQVAKLWLAAFRLNTLLLGLAACLLWPLGIQGIDAAWSATGQELAVQHSLTSAQPILNAPFSVSVDFFSCLLAGDSVVQTLWLFSRLTWSLLVCAMFGSIICRCVALRYSTGRTSTLRDGYAYCAPRAVQFWLAPMLPILACGVLLLVRSMAHAATWLPGIGDYLYLAMSIPLTGGLWALLFFGAVSWPLMFASQSVEPNDCFDGLSRGINFTLTRPLLYGLHVATFAIVGVGGTYLAAAFISAATGSATAGWLGWLMSIVVASFATTGAFAWATFTFLFLREQVDATETDEIYHPGSMRTDAVPLVGRAAHPVST